MQEFQEKRGIQMRHMWGMTELAPMGSVAGLKVPTACAPSFDRLISTGLGTDAFFCPRMSAAAYLHARNLAVTTDATVQGTLPPMSREERMALQLKQVRVLALSLVPPR